MSDRIGFPGAFRWVSSLPFVCLGVPIESNAFDEELVMSERFYRVMLAHQRIDRALNDARQRRWVSHRCRRSASRTTTTSRKFAGMPRRTACEQRKHCGSVLAPNRSQLVSHRTSTLLRRRCVRPLNSVSNSAWCCDSMRPTASRRCPDLKNAKARSGNHAIRIQRPSSLMDGRLPYMSKPTR